jgi:hypothetical protein
MFPMGILASAERRANAETAWPASPFGGLPAYGED